MHTSWITNATQAHKTGQKTQKKYGDAGRKLQPSYCIVEKLVAR
jgi:hypothetical protein